MLLKWATRTTLGNTWLSLLPSESPCVGRAGLAARLAVHPGPLLLAGCLSGGALRNIPRRRGLLLPGDSCSMSRSISGSLPAFHLEGCVPGQADQSPQLAGFRGAFTGWLSWGCPVLRGSSWRVTLTPHPGLLRPVRPCRLLPPTCRCCVLVAVANSHERNNQNCQNCKSCAVHFYACKVFETTA